MRECMRVQDKRVHDSPRVHNERVQESARQLRECMRVQESMGESMRVQESP